MDGRYGGTDGRDGWEERRRDGCDGNYEVGAYGMEWVLRKLFETCYSGLLTTNFVYVAK